MLEMAISKSAAGGAATTGGFAETINMKGLRKASGISQPA